jgi:hypothetical protein
MRLNFGMIRDHLELRLIGCFGFCTSIVSD